MPPVSSLMQVLPNHAVDQGPQHHVRRHVTEHGVAHPTTGYIKLDRPKCPKIYTL